MRVKNVKFFKFIKNKIKKKRDYIRYLWVTP